MSFNSAVFVPERKSMDQFAYRRTGSTGCEILTPDGTVVAWTVDTTTAVIIVALLNRTGREGLGAARGDGE